MALSQLHLDNAHDDEHAPRVLVIDDVFASQYFPNQDPIGKRINLKGGDDDGRSVEIVGIVKHVKQWGLAADDKESLRAQAYEPFVQTMTCSPWRAGTLRK